MVTLKDPGFNSANQDGAGDGTTTAYSTPSSPPQRNSTFAGDNKSYYTTTDDAYDPTNVGQPRKGYSDYGGGEATSYYAERAPDGYTLAGQKNGYDDDGLTHQSNPAPLDDSPVTPLVRNMGQKQYQDLEYAEPYKDPNQPPPQAPKGLASFFANAKYPLQQRIEDKKRGIGRQRTPFVVYATTAAMVAIFIYELVLNSREQGSPISTKPVINPMLGPSSSALVNLGARFPPCMKFVEQVPPSTPLACMNNTANPIDQICPVSELCGFGGIDVAKPNQWFRFVTAIFLHAGIVHIVINMLAQLSLSAQIEREMGSGGFIITYFAAGIFGNVLGGNFSLVGVPSVGASGAIFGTVAVTWVDLVAHWKYHYRPVRKLVFMTIELLIGIAIGYIPYVDNFAHIGGFVMGLLVGTVFYPIISETKRHKTIAWVFKLAAIPIAIILFVVLVRNFYTSDPYAACSGCRYLSCFPTASNNHCKGTGLTTSSGNAF